MLKKFKNYLREIDNRVIEKHKLRLNSQEISSVGKKSQLVANNPRRLKILLSKFQNEFVISDKTFLTLQKQKGDQHRMTRTIVFSHRNSSIQLQEAMSRLRKVSTSSSEEDEALDSFEGRNNQGSTRDSNRKRFNRQRDKIKASLRNRNQEMKQAYNRKSDLRTLEAQNFRKRNLELNKDTFDQAYYPLMKKNTPQYKKIKSQYSFKSIQEQGKERDSLPYPSISSKSNNIVSVNENNIINPG